MTIISITNYIIALYYLRFKCTTDNEILAWSFGLIYIVSLSLLHWALMLQDLQMESKQSMVRMTGVLLGHHPTPVGVEVGIVGFTVATTVNNQASI